MKYLLMVVALVFLCASSAFAVDISLSWTAPTKNTDGTDLTDLAGYRILVSNTQGQYNGAVQCTTDGQVDCYREVSADVTSLTFNLMNFDVTYYFVGVAYNTSGNVSEYSNEAIKRIAAPSNTNPDPMSDLVAECKNVVMHTCINCINQCQ